MCDMYTIMEIVNYPDDRLKSRCSPVSVFDAELEATTEQMTILMYESRGVGISAPQVGLGGNIIIVDPSSGANAKDLKVMVNPNVTWSSRECVRLSEGCLSMPGVILSIERPEWIEVEYQTLKGERVVSRHGDWVSRIVQHEIDHLRGKMMIDHVSSASKSMFLTFYASKKRRRMKYEQQDR